MINFMQYFFAQHFFFLCLIFVVSTIFSALVLTLINKSSAEFLSFLHVKAEKSPTNASLLGGLALTFSALSAVGILLFFDRAEISKTEILVLKCSVFPVFITAFYGFLDDKFEIRARHKLSMQIISVASLAVPLMSTLYHSHWESLTIAMVFGLAYINGSNLIDGLDTLFAKIGTVTALGFFILGLKYNSIPVLALSTMTCGSMAAFYFFNREPAKVYAGEIGGSLLGMMLFIQANLLFAKVHTIGQASTLNTGAMVLIVSIYPLSELGVTFFRRIFFKQSPFRGDRLHIHHIIKSNFNLNATKTSNAIATILVITMSIGFILTEGVSAVWAFAATVGSLSFIYSSTCFKHWKNAYSNNNKKEIFMSLNEKMIHVIDGKAIDMLYSKYSPNYSATDEDSAA